MKVYQSIFLLTEIPIYSFESFLYAYLSNGIKEAISGLNRLNMKFQYLVVNYFDFFFWTKSAFLTATVNSPFFELKCLVFSQFTTLVNILNIAQKYNFR